MRATAVIFVLAMVTVQTEADSTMQIISDVKEFRSGVQDLFAAAAAKLDEQGEAEKGKKIQAWSDTWLSLIGLNTGLTGLAKNYVFNYLGRASYHDNNGPLVRAIRAAAKSMPHEGQVFDAKEVRNAILAMCKEGTQIFAAGDSLHKMLAELKDIFKDGQASKAFFTVLEGNDHYSSHLFEFLAGKRAKHQEAEDAAKKYYGATGKDAGGEDDAEL